MGLSGFAHDSAAALLSETGIVAAIEEYKLARTRTAGIPREAIRFVLRACDSDWRQVECIAVASQPLRTWARSAWLRTKLAPVAPVSSGYYYTRAVGDLGRQLNQDRHLHLLGDSSDVPVHNIEHHLCHAASAFYASPADRALVLTLDERGDGWAGAVSLGEGTNLQLLESIAFPHSVGWVFSQVTELIGFKLHQDEHKTQWFGITGDPVFEDLFLQVLRRKPGDLPQLDLSYFNRGLTGDVAFSSKFYRAIGVEAVARKDSVRISPRAPLADPLRLQLAASVQQASAKLISELVERFRIRTGVKSLCLAGGVFLNPVLVSEVEKNAGFESVFVQPAAGNEGTALGAAWYVRHQMQGAPRQAPVEHCYWGPSYSNQEVKAVLDNCKALYRFHESEDRKVEEAIRLLNAGKIVAWDQGPAEFGPRALGNRSVLASPWAPYVKENLNEFIKHREAFRPFAIAVPAERAAEFFDFSPSARFMATLASAKPDARKLLEGLLLPGDLVRLHVVENAANSRFWNLLGRFGENAPAPMLINTSFNMFGEPLVVSPRDAVRSYFCSGIDALIIESFSLMKS